MEYEHLVNRIVMLMGWGMTLRDIHFQVMTGDRRPDEYTFFLAYQGAKILLR